MSLDKDKEDIYCQAVEKLYQAFPKGGAAIVVRDSRIIFSCVFLKEEDQATQLMVDLLRGRINPENATIIAKTPTPLVMPKELYILRIINL
jgi:hypothetical protein